MVVFFYKMVRIPLCKQNLIMFILLKHPVCTITCTSTDNKNMWPKKKLISKTVTKQLNWSISKEIQLPISSYPIRTGFNIIHMHISPPMNWTMKIDQFVADGYIPDNCTSTSSHLQTELSAVLAFASPLHLVTFKPEQRQPHRTYLQPVRAPSCVEMKTTSGPSSASTGWLSPMNPCWEKIFKCHLNFLNQEVNKWPPIIVLCNMITNFCNSQVSGRCTWTHGIL